MRRPVWAILLSLTFVPSASIAQTDAFAALIGAWEGEWKITQGTEDIAGKFRVTFSVSSPAPEGHFMNLELTRTRLDGKPSVNKAKLSRRDYKVEKLQALSADPPRYRWFAAENCWNVEIKAGQMEGFFNAGPCSNMGMGAGVRAVDFVAKKTGG